MLFILLGLPNFIINIEQEVFVKGFGQFGSRHRQKHIQRQCLIDTPQGKEVIVADFSKCCETRKKLLSLGIFPGQCIKMQCRRKNSPVIINTGGSNIIISEDLAKKIYIK